MTIDALRACGVNVEEGLGRCMNNEAFYLRLAGMALADGNFDKLAQAVEKGNYKEAFEAAHALKGVTGNLSLTPVYEPVCEITELLRAGTEKDCSELLGKILEAREKLRAL